MYKNPASDTYIVFGEAKIEDLSQQAQMEVITLLNGFDDLYHQLATWNLVKVYMTTAQAANRFKAAEMPSSTAEAASVPAAIAEEEEEGEEVNFQSHFHLFIMTSFSG